jgi:DMSO/TMAO reductase YedYZ molybdopterin-dependent catalytic subunit
MEPNPDQPRNDHNDRSEAPSTEGPSGENTAETNRDQPQAASGAPAHKNVDAKPAEPWLIKPPITRWKSSDSSAAINEREFGRMSRRELLKIVPVIALGAFAIPCVQDVLLSRGLKFSDWASARLFRVHHLAPTFSDSELTPFEEFPLNDYDVDDPRVNLGNWTLRVTGAVQKPGDYALAQIQTLPRTRQNTRHVCVEGWDVVGRFGGARLCDFLKMIGADTSAKFITVQCADDYYESLDMATALHPQTLLCWEMYDRPLTREHGAPLRLNVPTKIGYKQAKYLTELKVTNFLDKVGYWEDQGYSEFYGL